MSDKTHMHDSGESYGGVVPTKRPNKSGKPPEEAVEERPPTKESAGQSNSYWTVSQENGPSGLHRVREAARKNGKLRFTALLHHITIDQLRNSYHSLKKKAAPGVDGATWEEYGGDLEAKLADLHGRIHRGAYRAQPSRRVWIQCLGTPRPLCQLLRCHHLLLVLRQQRVLFRQLRESIPARKCSRPFCKQH